MTANRNQFVPTVGTAILRDVEADKIVAKSKTLINSSISQTVENQEIVGGEFSKLLYDYNYGKRLTATLEDARFDESWIALQSGTEIKNELKNVYKFEEKITLDGSGKGSVADTPVGNVYVQDENGQIQTIVPVGKDFTVPSMANKVARVTYRYSDTVDNIPLHGDNFPKAYELTIQVKVFDKTGHIGNIEWTFPQYKPNGNFDLGFAADSPITTSMEGKILADEDGSYGSLSYQPVGGGTIKVVQLASSPSEVQLDSADNSDSETLQVIGLRGGNYSNVIIDNSKLTFTVDDDSVCQVDANGVITHASPVATASVSTVIRITDGTNTDTVVVDII